MSRLKKTASSLTLAFIGFSIALVFQNCGGMEAAYNPLYDSSLTAGCMGIACAEDVNFVGFRSTVSGVVLDPKQATSSDTACDNSTCFDLGGYCETGGFSMSRFYYQWTLAGQASDQPIATPVSCDDNGRFQVQIKIPSIARFDYSQTHSLRLYMKIVDDDGIEQAQPNDTAQWTYVVTVRTN
jgi:hypothetical protein